LAPDSAGGSPAGTRPAPSVPLSGTTAKAGPAALSLVAEGFHYIRNHDATEELYDVVRDPTDSVDLMRTPAAALVLPRLRTLTDSLVRF
jgi:hypothetical protein